jgi:hypothetical protein
MRNGKGVMRRRGDRKRSAVTLMSAAAALGIAIFPMSGSALAKSPANTAGPPTLTHAVQPTYSAGNITKCPAGTTTFINTSDSSSGNQSASYVHNGTTFQATVDKAGVYISFTTNSPSFTVYVKGGPAYDTYDYTGSAAHPSFPSDAGLHSPYNPGGNIAMISHYLVCGQPTTAKGTPGLTTTPSRGGAVGSVAINDTATLSGGASAGGSITFNLYDPSHADCSGTPAYTQTVTVTGNGSYATTNTTPATTAGTWSWTAVYSGDANNAGASSSCGKETVNVTPAVPQGSCEGSGSISTLVSGKDVVSYVPKGNWGSAATGIDVVNVEGTSITNTLVPTGSDVINSCASNSVTGQTVCTANNNDVYILRGTGLDPSVPTNPLSDGGSGTISFSGGTATTTGVSMDATDNQALIALSVGGTGGFQFLDLASDTFEPAFTTMDSNGQISEDPLIDPVHHLVVSAAEDNNFELVDVSARTAPKFFEHPVGMTGGELDSSAEDCSTGIVFAPGEFSSPSQVEIADITQPNAVFTAGSPGSWAAPEQVQTLTGSDLSAGPSGSAVAQGTNTGVVAGEFGGDGLTALALPTTSGSGAAPAFSNWVTCETGPDASGNAFSMGDDPHTMAAYQSPNGGDAVALLVNEAATQMVKVDLTSMLKSSVVPATGNVCDSGTLPSSVETFIPLP